MAQIKQNKPSFDERQYLRNLYNWINKERDEISDKLQEYDGETMGRLARLKLTLIQQKLEKFAIQKGWLSKQQEQLCDLDLAQKMEENKHCLSCG